MTGFKNNQFDSIFSNLSLHVVPDTEKMLNAVNRVLKSKGKFSFSVMGRPEFMKFDTMLNPILKKHGIVLE